MLKFFKRKVDKQVNVSNRKSNITEYRPVSTAQAISNALQFVGTSGNKVDSRQAIFYYGISSPVSTAIDWVNDEFKTLDIIFKNIQTGESVQEHSVLELLNKPNDDMTLTEFLERYGAFYLICNEVYIMATSLNENSEISEMFIISPENVDIVRDPDGMVKEMKVTHSNGAKDTFKRSEKGYRFYNANSTAELWQVKGFNPNDKTKGLSKLQAIKYELDQYLQLSIHNLSVLSKGLRSSGAFTTDENLTDDQFERLSSQIQELFSGVNNSGKSLILENGLKFSEMSINPKDMDFKELRKATSIAVFNRFKVPLALMNTDSMTLSNLESSKYNLYDNAVIPMARKLLSELTLFLAPRYKIDSSKFRLAEDLSSISALQYRHLENTKLKRDLNIFTTNELRNNLNFDEVVDGNNVYIPNNLKPLGQDDPIMVTKTSRHNFIELMKSQKDLNGERKFTDSEIVKIADKEGLK